MHIQRTSSPSNSIVRYSETYGEAQLGTVLPLPALRSSCGTWIDDQQMTAATRPSPNSLISDNEPHQLSAGDGQKHDTFSIEGMPLHCLFPEEALCWSKKQTYRDYDGGHKQALTRFFRLSNARWLFPSSSSITTYWDTLAEANLWHEKDYSRRARCAHYSCALHAHILPAGRISPSTRAGA